MTKKSLSKAIFFSGIATLLVTVLSTCQKSGEAQQQSVVPISSYEVVTAPAEERTAILKTCNGEPATAVLYAHSNAISSNVLGVVPYEGKATLTGNEYSGGGIEWVEVRVLVSLEPINDPNAVNQDLRANQIGLVDACFVEE